MPVDLSDIDLRVWQASLRQPLEIRERIKSMLSADDRARADRIRVTEQRDSFVAARGVLRDILGRYLDVEPVGRRLRDAEKVARRFFSPFEYEVFMELPEEMSERSISSAGVTTERLYRCSVSAGKHGDSTILAGRVPEQKRLAYRRAEG